MLALMTRKAGASKYHAVAFIQCRQDHVQGAPHDQVLLPGESSGAQPVLEPVEQWRGMQEAAGRLGLQPVGDLTNSGRGKHTTRHVSLLKVCS